MHVEPAYSQSLMPRLAQHPVRRQLIQSRVHPATDDRTDYAADGTADRAADCGGHGDLRRHVVGLRTDAA
jgi:hypothetical protein